MFRRYPKLIFLATILVFVFAPVGLTKYVGGDHDQWTLVALFALAIAMLPLARVVARLEFNLEQANYERRLLPVKQSLEECSEMTEGKEIHYRNRLARQLFRSLKVAPTPESPLPSGTKVDAYMEFGDEDWYITVKRGLDNQQRLTLLGEIEDIILHAPTKGRDTWIYVVVGISEKMDPKEVARLSKLREYATRRSLVDARAKRDRRGESNARLNIEVMPVFIPSMAA